ncbi:MULTISPECIES: 1-acyl-sn-glycerol-3-phosphate acyltransferase [unclassified Ruegeria]|uniref:lysophospholipid acyltransferase family protein n=1 Tax=unclassified Ruegeria TaxID=2625375 RepID=UPI00148926B6|nr:MULTISPECIES: lysophospholipid acyltransferase family protein [unclassified Ruegeria]NOD76548.1 1-acyl-sn-glycerol-3-phosphate acyltransferase [Ruegeria sp. HKCCD4332]NOD89268.1 1-acyl-sn-glycerol-3-phosphate acyltransferase [Ruegeria sp. HKCCD4318]NOD92728.1 1-acyl-sn-glycerol-3-phosphate acyltransferase [Ruegeria sp. HKCCD4884]NOE13569.1 1-acyl-sn-glycerol-3-phosphate acyltransferase [Ruegeria sp. HKCCD4318-2]NOG07681.1 1-acyl-sn-glycerol-3-phosphate acyltransferase [Ruegeria sp. HKCCD431
MFKAVQWVRSLVFMIVIYAWMLILGIVFLPYALFSKRGALRACKTYAHSTMWLARWMVGIRCEVRGTAPTNEVVVGAKHQSFLDIIMIFSAIPHGKFIMKRELLFTPVIGMYARRLGCIPVNRGKRGAAVAKMVKDVAKEFSEPGQLVIYPQGTRVAPGVKKPYKIGTAVLYEGLGVPCVPVATNAGVFWPRTGVMRKPGLAIVDFLEPIEPGVERDDFLGRLEDVIETRSNELMREVGFDPDGHH